jgi:hypothetical protein
MPLGNLFVSIRATATEWASDMKAIQRDAKDLEKSIKPLKDQVQTFGLAMTAVGGAVVGAFAAMTKSTADYLDNLNDARQKTGVAANDLARLGFAAEQSGSSFDGMSTGLRFLAKNMEDASSGGKKQAQAFSALGVSVVDATGKLRPTNEVMLDVADRFSGMEDGAGKTAIAMDIFGKSGADLIPTLNSGSAGLKAMGDEHERLSGIITDESTLAADQFNDSLGSLSTAVQGITLAVGSAFIPAMTDMITKVTDIVAAVRDWAAEHPGLIRAVGYLAVAITGAGGLLLGVAGVMAILPQLTVAFTLLTAPVSLTIGAVAGITAAIIYFRKEIAGSLLFALSKAVEAFGEFIGFAAKMADAVGLDGVAGKLKGMQFSVEETSRSLDEMSNRVLNNAVTQTDKVAQATRRHTVELQSATQASKDAELAAQKHLDALKAMGNTYEAGLAIERSLAAAHVDLAAKGRELQGTLERLGQTQILEPLTPDMAIFQMHQIMDILNKSTVPGLKTELEKIPEPVDHIAINMKKVQDATEDVKRSAGKIFDDMFIKGESVFTSLQNMLKGGALSLGRAIFEDVTGALLGPIKKAFDDFFEGLLEGTGIKALISGLGQKIGGALGGLFGGGGSIAGGTGSLAGSVGSFGSTIGGTATSLAGGLVSGGIAALGSIVAGVMSRGNLKRTEENTRETRDWLEIMATAWNPVFFEMLAYQKWIADRITILTEHQMAGIVDALAVTYTEIRLGVFEARDSVVDAIEKSTEAIVNALASIAMGGGTNGMPRAPRLPGIAPSLAPAALGPAGTYGTPFLNFGVPGTGRIAGTGGTPFLNFGVPNTSGGLPNESRSMSPNNSVIINIANVNGTDRESARRVAQMISDEVKSGGIRLAASDLRR